MTISETLYLGKMPLGRLHWDDDSNLSWFAAYRDNLHPLTQLSWADPVEAREFIQAYAQQVQGVA